MDDFALQTEQIGARLERFIRKSRLKSITVAQTLGVAPSIITGMKQGGNYYGNRLVELCQAYPQLNPTWLLTGEGTMLNHGDHPQLSAHSERLRNITEAIDELPVTAPASDNTAIRDAHVGVNLLMDLICQRAELLALVADRQRMALQNGSTPSPSAS